MTTERAHRLLRWNGDASAAIEDALPINSVSIEDKTPKPEPVAQTFPIMRLPLELREEVFKHHAIDFMAPQNSSMRIRVFLAGNNGRMPTAIPLPPLTKAGSRQVRLEVLSVTIKLITFEIHSGPGNAKLQRWLEGIDLGASGQTSLKTGFDAVHSLIFPYFSRFPFYLPSIMRNNDIELARRCANLRTLKILFARENLYDDDGSPQTVQQLRTNYRLDGMLGLANLQFLGLQSFSYPAFTDPALRDLKVWFETEFRERSQGVNVVIERAYA